MSSHDRARLQACRAHVVARFCANRAGCSDRVVAAYQALVPSERFRWLLDYSCPRATIRRADAMAEGLLSGGVALD